MTAMLQTHWPQFETINLLDPLSGRTMVADQPWSLTGGVTRWPVVAGIPYLRVGRDALRLEVLAALDADDEQRALVLLLADQDDFARIAPPDVASCASLVEAVGEGRASLRSAMVALQFGPVADYFAFRWSSPTYLSGLVLLERFAGGADAGPVVELACGVGHYLRDLAGRGRQCAGVDVVFSKLWLARQFVVPDHVPLICADVVEGWPIGPIAGGAVAFCHDAFYFLSKKSRVVTALQRLVGTDGRILIGHAHNRNFDHGGVAGEPQSPAEYANLLSGCRLWDDAALARSGWTDESPPECSPAQLDQVEAVALVWGHGDLTSPEADHSLLKPRPGTRVKLNPLLREADGQLVPDWPSSRFAAEYAAASDYLTGEPIPEPFIQARAEGGMVGSDPEVDRLARRRIFLDLPERW